MSVPIGVGSGGGPLTLHIVVGGTGDFTERPVLTVKCARHRTVRWLITEIRKCLRNDLISELRYLPRQKWPTSGADAAREQEAAADSSPAGSRGGGGLGLTLEPLSVSALLVTPTVIEELPLPLDLAVGEIGVPDHAMALALLSGMRRSAQTRYVDKALPLPLLLLLLLLLRPHATATATPRLYYSTTSTTDYDEPTS